MGVPPTCDPYRVTLTELKSKSSKLKGLDLYVPVNEFSGTKTTTNLQAGALLNKSSW